MNGSTARRPARGIEPGEEFLLPVGREHDEVRRRLAADLLADDAVAFLKLGAGHLAVDVQHADRFFGVKAERRPPVAAM